MLALQITSLKTFMSAMLTGELFDSFLLQEASITTAASYTIDGRVNKAFFPPEERDDTELHPYEFALWKDMKSTCYDLIKGKYTPTHFHFVLQLAPTHTASILEKGGSPVSPDFIKAFVLNIRFDGEKVLLYTGIAYTTFLTDKEPERLWDAAIKQFLYKKGIACEEL
ncbi:MAG: hypothetical protein J1E65_06440 [Lachnospiraceae bacterium]|nr:hypothetical protein [Lachnospiraceae bacterium]